MNTYHADDVLDIPIVDIFLQYMQAMYDSGMMDGERPIDLAASMLS